jgi:hypothetical protein
MTAAFPTTESASAYRKAHDARVRALSRMTVAELRRTEQAHLTAQGLTRILGGPGSKDEVLRAIIDAEFPADLMNEASHVLYHKPGENWSACEHCPKAGF